jgi:hypothetical protein
MGRTETDRQVTHEPGSSMKVSPKNQDTHTAPFRSQRTSLLKKVFKKVFDRADIVRDGRGRDDHR